jgi:hypothetical protein
MCFLNEPGVADQTKIFVASDASKTHQITVYSNRITTTKSNIMIIPVPYPQSVKIIDISKISNIFTDLDNNFINNNENSFQETKICGSYKCTIVMSLPELNHINHDIFGHINDHIKYILERYYLSFGFIVCCIKPQNENTYEPLAYSHRLLPSGCLFIPTRCQYNTKGFTPSIFPSFDYSTDVDISMEITMYDEDDDMVQNHEIYSFNTLKKYGNSIKKAGPIHFKSNILNFDFGKINSINKLVLNGKCTNRDLILKIES